MNYHIIPNTAMHDTNPSTSLTNHLKKQTTNIHIKLIID